MISHGTRLGPRAGEGGTAVGVPVGRTTVDLALGPQTARVRPVVVDFGHVNTSLTGCGVPAVDGILGDSVLQHFAAVIDYAGTRLYLLPPELQVPTELAG